MAILVDRLAAACGLSVGDVRAVLATAPLRYKTYAIPKRNGGARIISQPAREVKFLQRLFSKIFLHDLPIHNAATAYRSGLSIKNNAEPHNKSGAILKLDFADFFPSIVSSDWEAYCLKNDFLKDDDDLFFSSNLLFRKTKYGSVLRLAIGAPSSPIVSNILMATFDAKIADIVSTDKVVYTRYADDLTFSAFRAGNLVNVVKYVRSVIHDMSSPRLRINETKTVLATRKFRRVVTGLVLTDDGKISIGRDKKRLIRSGLHHYILGRLNDEESARLAGLLAHVNSVEPDFVLRLAERYGIDKVEKFDLRRSEP